ncbi:hypothetical protein OsI_20544 [Oryza sativa Indica Group]|uniref:Uncharacterized protein n=1 Tax=Oryza sativa subsp. indica TaxID=39946 RepID=A2Y6A9_ORYSI|nr:hypothetical protein OsI_20544 [Oryza sativa Indica Group]
MACCRIVLVFFFFFFFCVCVLVATTTTMDAVKGTSAAAAGGGGGGRWTELTAGSPARYSAGADEFRGSKRRIPKGPDPIHNRNFMAFRVLNSSRNMDQNGLEWTTVPCMNIP